MQRINNMGSLLQAYALKKVLESIGCEVSFIDIKKREEDNALINNNTTNYHRRTRIFEKIKKIDAYTFNRINIKKKADKQDLLFEDFRKKHLDIDHHFGEYDLCIIGSDEVFNCLNAGEWGFTTQLFGNIPEANHIITYAASCGATCYNDLPLNIISKIHAAFKNIEGFSVRDNNTREFVLSLTENKDVDIHFDPVLIYDFYDEISDAKLVASTDRYCIIYSYYNRIQSLNDAQRIMEFCHENKLTPIAVGAPQYWLREYITCTPFECLKLFQNAEYVITDTFHGTVFAAKYSKRFAVMTRPSNYNKLSDLINRLNVEAHLIKDFSQLNENFIVLKQPIDSLLNEEKCNTISYLDKYCKNEK